MKKIFVYTLASLMVFCFLSWVPSNAVSAVNNKNNNDAVRQFYGKLPLYFIANDGQTDERVRFYEKGAGRATFFTTEGIYLSLVKNHGSGSKDATALPVITNDHKDKIASSVDNFIAPQFEVVKLILLSINKNLKIVGEGLEKGKVNYFVGNNPKEWKSNIPTYKAVVYKEIYKDIDIKFYGNNSEIEYDVIIKPGADPSVVKFSYEGIEGLELTDGGLEIKLKGGEIFQKKLFIYQDIDGKRVTVQGKFIIFFDREMKNAGANRQFVYGFDVAQYNKNYPLIIDPVLVYSTYLGGGWGDSGYGVSIDASGNAYVTGQTYSPDFPTQLPIQGSLRGGNDDAFVTKINPDGNALVYSTYFGGSGKDCGFDISVDTSGNAYVGGVTNSSDFPTQSPIQGSYKGEWDTFIAKINPEGNALVYSTYLGGSGDDIGYALSVDTQRNVYVTGLTGSTTDFPTQSPIQGRFGGGWISWGGGGGGWWDGALAGGDAFVTKINPEGTALVYSTYLGGSSFDYAHRIFADASGNAYVAGTTYSTDFPIQSPIQGSFGGLHDAFVTKINPEGTALVYSTYLGGNSYDIGIGISADISGNAYVAGTTYSPDFPTRSPIQGSYGGTGWWWQGGDAFVTKINTEGDALVYSTYLGGSSDDAIYDIYVDTSGSAYVTGLTNSTNFPIQSPIQMSFRGGQYDAFVTKINPDGNALVYSTYFGGDSYDHGIGISADTSGNAYVAGLTYSSDFPMQSPLQESSGGGRDAFVAKIGIGEPSITVGIDIKPGSFPNSINLKSKGTIPVAILTTEDFDAVTINPLSVRFGITMAEDAYYTSHIEDVDNDGDMDFLFHFSVQDVGIRCGDSSIALSGGTFEGQEIIGLDSIKTIGCNYPS